MNLDQTEKDVVHVVSDFEAALIKAAQWSEKICSGELNSRAVSSLASELGLAIAHVKAQVDELERRLGVNTADTAADVEKSEAAPPADVPAP